MENQNSTAFRGADGGLREKPADTKATWRPSVYGVLIRDSRILLVKSAVSGLWELPGGGVDDGETLIDALVREFAEETGYRVKPASSLPFKIDQNQYFDLHRDRYHYGLLLNYFVELIGDGRDESLLYQSVEGEIVGMEWVSYADCSSSNVHPTHWPAVSCAIAL